MPTSRLLAVISIVLILFVIAAGLFLWWPKYQTFTATSQQLASYEAQLKKKIEYFNNLYATQVLSENYKDQIAKVNSALPENLQVDVSNLAAFLLKTAAENSLFIKEVKWSEEKAGGGESKEAKIGTVPFAFEMNGNYQSLKSFLEKVYKNARLIEVKAIGFSSKDEFQKAAEGVARGGVDKFDFSMEIAASYYNEKSQNEK